MKRRSFLCVVILAILLLAVVLTACNNIGSKYPEYDNPLMDEFTIRLTGNDLCARAIWEPVPEAVYYLCKIYTIENNARIDVMEYTLISDWYGFQVCETEIPIGYGVEVIPLDADRQAISIGKQLISNIFIDPNEREAYRYPNNTPEIHPTYTIYWDDMTIFDILDTIRVESIVVNANGSVAFESVTPDGKTIRFFGTGVEFKNDNLIIYEEGRIWGLDALGRVMVCDVHTIGDLPSRDSIALFPMYKFSSKTSVEHVVELYEGSPNINNEILGAQDYLRIGGYNTQGNYFSIGTIRAYGQDASAVEIDKLIVYYDTKTYTTGLKELEFNRDFTGSYLVGDLYDESRERFDPSQGIYDFYLLYRIDDMDRKDMSYIPPFAPIESDSQYKVGNLRDKNGNVLNKETDGVELGATIDVTMGDYTLTAPLVVLPRIDDAYTQHELVPYAYPKATGDLNVLVVPLFWQDTPGAETEKNLSAIYQSLGRVISADGSVNDYSDGVASNGYSLSEYYDTASYGQLNLASFVTDWCYLPYNSEQNAFALSYEVAQDILDKIYKMYPNMNFSSFDQDENGYFDSVIFINVQTIGVTTMNFYTPIEAGTPEKPGVNCYINISLSGLGSSVIIHELGHNLGLVDYYDVNYSGIDAVGSFDMQSQSLGDWNPYSKYSVGWISPEVITGLTHGESVEIEIGAFANTGDAIVIPGAESFYNGTPFGEYIMIDLFTDYGLNENDALSYGLQDSVGVRIYHVNSVMEGRVLSRDGQEIADGEGYSIGTINKANTYSGIGSYHLELIQAGGDNTFTDLDNLRTMLQKEDLFIAGDSFDASEYTEFFHNGLLDDHKDFGYMIEIVSITAGDTPTATIRITRK